MLDLMIFLHPIVILSWVYIVFNHIAEALDVVCTQDIEGEFLERLWESMPRRVAAVLDARGWYTKY